MIDLQAFAGVRNVQRGNITTLPTSNVQTINITISAVNLSKSFVNVSFFFIATSTHFSAQLTSATNLQIIIQTQGHTFTIPWEVIEFM